jgi:uncharacterized coiled-coil protein SlyX
VWKISQWLGQQSQNTDDLIDQQIRSRQTMEDLNRQITTLTVEIESLRASIGRLIETLSRQKPR